MPFHGCIDVGPQGIPGEMACAAKSGLQNPLNSQKGPRKDIDFLGLVIEERGFAEGP